MSTECCGCLGLSTGQQVPLALDNRSPSTRKSTGQQVPPKTGIEPLDSPVVGELVSVEKPMGGDGRQFAGACSPPVLAALANSTPRKRVSPSPHRFAAAPLTQ